MLKLLNKFSCVPRISKKPGHLALIYKLNHFDIFDIEYKYNIPHHFINITGSTPGYTFNNEIWFVVNTQLQRLTNINCQHFFIIFDFNYSFKMFYACAINFRSYSLLFILQTHDATNLGCKNTILIHPICII
jgi:hypothetical protein